MVQYILISSLFSYGMFTIQRPGFILNFMRKFWKQFPKSIHETLFECGVCVASIWGGLCFLYISYVIPMAGYYTKPLFWLPVIIISASGLNAFLDRAVKFYEKGYGYKAPVAPLKGEEQWSYLMPYDSLRKILADNFVSNAIRKNHLIVEIGGFHEDWRMSPNYVSYGHKTPFDRNKFASILGTNRPYSVIIMGLAFDGDIRLLKDLIRISSQTMIEYSDDGISRQQVEFLTESIPVKLVVPEFSIPGPENAPKACGSVEKRKIILLNPPH